MAVVDSRRHDLCWACGPGSRPRRGGFSWSWYARALTYEEMVEHIESLPPRTRVSIPYLADRFRRTPTTWTVARLVVRDLHLHGLLRCIHPTPGGCRGYYVSVGWQGVT
jgi:hypothetical protein